MKMKLGVAVVLSASAAQYFANRGSIAVTGNRVGGNLRCKENRPRPTGGRNIVHGNKEDQCARL